MSRGQASRRWYGRFVESLEPRRLLSAGAFDLTFSGDGRAILLWLAAYPYTCLRKLAIYTTKAAFAPQTATVALLTKKHKASLEAAALGWLL